LQDSADAARTVADYYQGQERGGQAFQASPAGLYNLLFTTWNFRVTQQDAAAQAEGNVALNLILIYRAMGGGWQVGRPHPGEMTKHGAKVCPSLPVPLPPAALPPASRPVEMLPPPSVIPQAEPKRMPTEPPAGAKPAAPELKPAPAEPKPAVPELKPVSAELKPASAEPIPAPAESKWVPIQRKPGSLPENEDDGLMAPPPPIPGNKDVREVGT
jgi:hypothetical protein